MTNPSEDLLALGVAVVPVLDERSRRWWETLVYTAMDDFPEYRLRGRNVQRVLGGFGALGNPSSFHHRTVRQFRRKLKRLAMRPVFADYARRRFPGGEHRVVRLESLFDRLCVRCESFLRPTPEGWHRDVYDGAKYKLRDLPHSLPGDQQDLLFGGWTNLDHREQSFVGLVASHDEHFGAGGGFATFSPDDVKRHRFAERLAAQANRAYGTTVHTDADGHIRVPPGHSVLFLQHLVHSVKSGPQPTTPSLRVFHGFRLTTETVPLFDVEGVVANGAVPRIPSGQMPPMYSQNHYAAFVHKTEDRWRRWAERTFRPECCYVRTTGEFTYATPGSRDDRNKAANKGRYMPSLSEMGLWNEEDFGYSPDEVQALYPQPLYEHAVS